MSILTYITLDNELDIREKLLQSGRKDRLAMILLKRINQEINNGTRKISGQETYQHGYASETTRIPKKAIGGSRCSNVGDCLRTVNRSEKISEEGNAA